jgi:hypothetical protein
MYRFAINGRRGGFGEHSSPPAEPAGHAGPAVGCSHKTGMSRNASFLISASVMRRDVLSRVGGSVQLRVGGLRL